MRWGLALLLVFLTGSLAAAARASTPAAACGKLLPPSHGAYFGAAPGYANEDAYWPGPEGAFDLDAGFKAVWTMFGQWWSNDLPFPTKAVKSIWADDKVPYIRLNPYPYQQLEIDYTQPNPPGPYTLQDIAAGKYDTQLRRWADTARDLNIPILAEFGTEVNNYFPWSPRNNGAGTTNGYGDPTYPDGAERFRDAYRHVVTVTREEGAANITWFFHADTLSYFAQEPWNAPGLAFPGDDYVDWLGLSLYAFPKFDGSGYTSLAEKLDDYHQPGTRGMYDQLTSISSRPLALVEVGFNRVPVAARVPWVTDAAATVKSGRFSRLFGLTWYSTSAVDFNDQITASPDFQAAFRSSFGDPFFRAQPQFSGDCAPSAPTRVTLRKRTLSWTSIPNAVTYEVWRGAKKLKTTDATSSNVTKPGPYRIRGVNLAGLGPFGVSR